MKLQSRLRNESITDSDLLNSLFKSGFISIETLFEEFSNWKEIGAAFEDNFYLKFFEKLFQSCSRYQSNNFKFSLNLDKNQKF